MLKPLHPLLLTVLLIASAPPHARAAPPLYAGTYVTVDPYNFADMTFLKCATETQATLDSVCSMLSNGKDGFLNPFTGTSTSGPLPQAANGILLRIPWCAFQTGAVTSLAESAPTLGECHYQVHGTSGTGTIYAGGYNGGPNGTFKGELKTSGFNQLNPTGSTVPDPQGGVDTAISNLSQCTTAYDVGSANCSNSVLDTALSKIAAIAGQLPPGTLKLSVSLYAGMYTPTSVMTPSIVPTLDFPQQEASMTSCARQPLAWHTTGVSPYLPNPYEKAYTAAVVALGAEIQKVLAGTGVQLTIIKESAITSNSIEFDVAARPAIMPTATDPSPPASPPQGGSIIKCPDQSGLGTVAALLNAYAMTGSTIQLPDAYENTFGYVTGFEAGLSSQSSGVSGALLSIPMKGQQVFAHVDCGVVGAATPCVADPAPHPLTPTAPNYTYDWNEYYFTNFVKDLSTPGTPASTAAAAGYARACANATCSPAILTVIPSIRISVVFTGLDVAATPGDYTYQPSCWLNNTDSNKFYALRLYNTDGTYIMPLPTIAGTGTLLGWQTQTGSGGKCGTSYNLQTSAIDNGGQYTEIETDAAAEPICASPLNDGLNSLISGAGNGMTHCFYPP